MTDCGKYEAKLYLYRNLVSKPKAKESFVPKMPIKKREKLTITEFWRSLNTIFIKQRNITFDRYVLLNQKQFNGEPMIKVPGARRGSSINCDKRTHEGSIIHDFSIENMLNKDAQREHSRKTFAPKRALHLTKKTEPGLQINTQFAGKITYTVSNSFRSMW